MIKTINPATQKEIASYEVLSHAQLNEKIDASYESFKAYKRFSIAERKSLLLKLAGVLEEKKVKYAHQVTLEMGKPIAQAESELDKCAWVCKYYAEKGEDFLSDTVIETDAARSFVTYEAIGTVLAIMPWNYPFWQVFRFLAPALMAGNSALIKHSPNTMGTAILIEEAVEEAGFPSRLVQNLVIDVDQVEEVIAHPVVKAVTLTGSGRAGSAVSAIAGKHIKKSVLELGGSNSFIVLEDADFEKALDIGVTARMQNNGQSCIAAKRFLIHEKIYDKYIDAFMDRLKDYTMGDPFDKHTRIGPLARVDLAEKLEKQVNLSVKRGAKLLLGGKRDSTFFHPTILTNVNEGMPAFDEELFGPAAAFMPIKDLDHAIELSNKSTFGLGVSVFSTDTEGVLRRIGEFEDGAVFINDMVKSDPRLPFGGTKQSGFGRELAIFGMHEFLNIKTVYVS